MNGRRRGAPLTLPEPMCGLMPITVMAYSFTDWVAARRWLDGGPYFECDGCGDVHAVGSACSTGVGYLQHTERGTSHTTPGVSS